MLCRGGQLRVRSPEASVQFVARPLKGASRFAELEIRASAPHEFFLPEITVALLRGRE
jgi:hypothetical protein